MVGLRDNGCHSPGRQEGNQREDCDVSVLLRKTEVVCGPPPGVMMDGTSHRDVHSTARHGRWINRTGLAMVTTKPAH